MEVKEGLLALGMSFAKAFDYSELSIGRVMKRCSALRLNLRIMVVAKTSGNEEVEEDLNSNLPLMKIKQWQINLV